MNLSDLHIKDTLEDVNFKVISKDSLPETNGEYYNFIFINNSYCIEYNHKLYQLQLISSEHAQTLATYVSRYNAMVAEIKVTDEMDKNKPNKLVLTIYPFITEHKLNSKIYCTDNFLSKFGKKKQKKTDLDNISRHFQFKISGNDYYLITRSQSESFNTLNSKYDNFEKTYTTKQNTSDPGDNEQNANETPNNNNLNSTQNNIDTSISRNDDCVPVPDFLQQFAKSNTGISSQQNDQKNLVEEILYLVSSDGINIRLEKTCLKSDENQKYLKASSCSKQNKKEQRYLLICGNLSFASESVSQKEYLNESLHLLDNNDSYLTSWEQYGKFEMLLTLKKIEQFGCYKINSVYQNNESLDFYFDRSINLELLEDGDMIEIIDTRPQLFDYNKEINVENFEEILTKYTSELDNSNINNSKQIINELFDKSTTEKKFVLSIDKSNSTKNKLRVKYNYDLGFIDNLVLKIKGSCSSEAVIEKSYYIALSSAGNSKMYLRRKLILDTIKNFNSANPLLRAILEKNTDTVIDQYNKNINHTKVGALSDRIVKKIFSRNPPTDVQKKAVEIALNTPDIALIQGPPGTGKTTVITALIECLNELYSKDKNKKITGNILVSGFQHDAVENIIKRLSVNSLPAVKFGQKFGSSYEETLAYNNIQNWAASVINKIRSNNTNLQVSEELNTWTDLCNEYQITPSKELEKILLETIITSNNPDVLSDSQLKNKASKLLKDFRFTNSVYDPVLLSLINSIRTTSAGFNDDGDYVCGKLLSFLDDNYPDVLTADDRNILQLASLNFEKDGHPCEDIKIYLKELKKIKSKLQYFFIEKNLYTKYTPKREIIDISEEMKNTLKKSSMRNKDNEEASVLSEFISTLENYGERVVDAVKEYQVVYAATTQQSLSNSIVSLKLDLSDENSNVKLPEYDTVIIDEAARANPTDLLIPMAMGKNRIILVGDHRQLPHMIDNDVISAMDGDSTNYATDKKLYEVSMFEYLFLRLKELEKIDGIQRTITLNAQYRTHPTLGEFCSKNFYERHDISEKYSSPLPADYFKQNLHNISNRYCTWFDVRYSPESAMKTKQGSKYREAEARICARCIALWLNDENSKSLTFGIITFYRAQVEEIMKCLAEHNIAELKYGTDTYEIKHEFRFNKDGSERLRIGTVDAFQGMEFDIVLLSLVRSFSDKELENSNYSKILGFLTKENRLCVSMSRQKKFLGVVGDSSFAKSKVCSDYCPALYNFYKLCEKGDNSGQKWTYKC